MNRRRFSSALGLCLATMPISSKALSQSLISEEERAMHLRHLYELDRLSGNDANRNLSHIVDENLDFYAPNDPLSAEEKEMLIREQVSMDGGVEFKGELSASDWIRPDRLIHDLSLRGERTKNSGNWLHVVIDRKELIISKQEILRCTRTELENRRVDDGSSIIKIDGTDYKLRLVSGFNIEAPDYLLPQNDHRNTVGSEWNRIFYRIHSGQKTLSTIDHKTDSLGVFSKLASYDDADLFTVGESFCLERRVKSFYYGRTHTSTRRWLSGCFTRAMAETHIAGWRPVFEKA